MLATNVICKNVKYVLTVALEKWKNYQENIIDQITQFLGLVNLEFDYYTEIEYERI